MEAPAGDQEPEPSEIEYLSYGGEHHLPLIMSLVDEELSEPYSIFTYRYFVYLWPNLTYLVRFSLLAFHRGKCVGTVVCKMGEHRSTFRGYIAMLVVIKPYRGKGIDSKERFFLSFLYVGGATELVTRAIRVIMESGCEEFFVGVFGFLVAAKNCGREHDSGFMTPKKVDALEEKLEGEIGLFKSEVEERISSMEERFSNLENMMKKILELHTQPATSEARAPAGGQESGGNPNIGKMRDDREV
ncbi:hypothetical protein M5K25_004937 [Dendrobium thyrsiflorum]|uniref:N-acetyltransferase domain-containing protein n=1 Tax=Dendrobium thyrsiflorum TaxID=117978 RepID=A0ABD0VMW1_DENTH